MSRVFALLALLLVGKGAAAPERQVTFEVIPAHAEVLIPNDHGKDDHYPVGKPIVVKFPGGAFDLKLEASGWKSERIPVLANQFEDRWPSRGSYQMQPVGLLARMSLWPRWPALLLLLLVPLGRRRRPSAVSTPVFAPGETTLPWELPVGATVGGYEIQERLGEGVTAVVYRVSSPEGPLALKLLKPDHFRHSEVMPRFRREMKSLHRLHHPGFPYLADFGEHQGMAYLVMELLGPESLSDSLKRGPMTEDQARPVLVQLCQALAFCHRQGILHRDIKPENVMWASDGGVRLSDFGLARPHDATTLTQEGALLGTPAYMAPEIVHGQPADAASDQYSLGCLGYHMLSGHPPYQGDNPLAVLMQHVSGQAEPLPGSLGAWVARLMAVSKEDRFASMEDALEAL